MKRFLPQGLTTKKAFFFSSAFLQVILAGITLSFTGDIYQKILESVRIIIIIQKWSFKWNFKARKFFLSTKKSAKVDQN